MTQQSLVSISEASHILGINEATLRQWTDEGKLKAFITPGGHRRYSRAELRKFISSHQKVLGIKDLVAELEDTVELHREIGRIYLASSWYQRLDPASQENFRNHGRNLLNLIISYIAEPSRRAETIRRARDTGHDFGETLAKLGLPLTDSVEAFIMHREPMIKATAQLMKQREVLSERVVEAFPLVTGVMDEVLVSLVAAHQEYRKKSGNEMTGGMF